MVYISGWWFLATPLKNVKVNWDDYSQYTSEKYDFVNWDD